MSDLLFLAILLGLMIGLVARSGYLFILAFVLLFTVGSARLWQRFGLARIEFGRHLSAREALPGDVLELKVSVANRKALPLTWLEWVDQIATPLEATSSVIPTHRADVHELAHVVSLRPYERVTRRYQVRCRRRGYHAIGPARLRSGDPFGLAWSERSIPARDHVLVHPRVRPVQEFGVPASDPFGDLPLRSRLFPDPSRIVGARQAAPGEPLRHLHWKASAGQGALYVKVLESSAAAGLSFFLDLRTGDRLWAGVDIEQQEFLIEAVAALAAEGLRRGRRVSLCANGISHLEPHGDCLRVGAGNGPAHIRTITRALGLLRRYPTIDFAPLLIREASRTSWRTTLCLFTHVVDEALVLALRPLTARGRPAVVFVTDATGAPALPPGVLLSPLLRAP